MRTIARPPAGRAHVRRFLTAAALTLVASLPAAHVRAAADPPSPDVTVIEDKGTYTVRATFAVRGSSDSARAVLTDYERIPRFMPDVRKSVVLERAAGRMVVEQEAVSKMMMFSKRVHLVLAITETPGTIRFEDQCGASFKRYVGSWTVSEGPAGVTLTYQLVAEPNFEVPGFLLKRLLRRDSARMIDLLRNEIAKRTDQPPFPHD